MNRIWKATGLIALALSMLACAVIPSIPGVGAAPTSLAGLWPDVPAMDGLTLAPSAQVPAFVNILLGVVTKQALGGGTASSDWVDFTTAKTPDDVRAFYTPDLMASNGWENNADSTCFNGADQGVAQVGAVCLFVKEADGNETLLVILATQDDKTKPTNVFFVRIEGPAPTPTPKP
jgi:hypothetical protein